MVASFQKRKGQWRCRYIGNARNWLVIGWLRLRRRWILAEGLICSSPGLEFPNKLERWQAGSYLGFLS